MMEYHKRNKKKKSMAKLVEIHPYKSKFFATSIHFSWKEKWQCNINSHLFTAYSMLMSQIIVLLYPLREDISLKNCKRKQKKNIIKNISRKILIYIINIKFHLCKAQVTIKDVVINMLRRKR